MRKRRIVGAVLAGALLLAACGSSEKSAGRTPTANPTERSSVATGAVEPGVYRTLTIDEFADIIANHASDYTIVNVHIPYAGEVDATDAFVPYDDLDALTAALPDKNAPIILYCRSGRMSEEASLALLDLGYTQLWDVPGGMNAWQASGRELIDK